MLLGSSVMTSTPMASSNNTLLLGAGDTGIGLDVEILRDTSEAVFVLELTTKNNAFVPPPIPKEEGIAALAIPSAADEAFIGFNAPTVVFRFSDMPYYPGPNDPLRPNQIPFAALINPGDIERSVPIAIEDQRRSQVSFGEAQIINADGRFDTIFDEYNPDKGQVITWIGPRWSNFSKFFQIGAATADLWYRSRDIITIPVTSNPTGLDIAFSLGVFDGTGDLGGDPSLLAKRKPFLYGREVYNITPILLNAANQVYIVSATQINAVHAVKDRGLPLTASVGDFADYFDLRDAVIPPGYYGTCLRLGLFKASWAGGTPAGIVTCDASGLVDESILLTSTSDFVEYVMNAVAGFTDVRLDIESIRNLPAGEITYYYDGSSPKTVEDVLDEILRPVNGFTILDRKNKFRFSTHTDPDEVDPIITLKHGLETDNDIISMKQEENDIDPLFNIQYNYNRNFTPLSDDQLSPAVSESDKIKLKAEYESLSVSNASLQFSNPSATYVEVNCFFKGFNDTKSVAGKQLAVRQARRQKHIIQVKLIGLSIDPGDVIRIIHPRFCPNGKNFLVYRVVDKLDQGTVEIGAYG